MVSAILAGPAAPDPVVVGQIGVIVAALSIASVAGRAVVTEKLVACFLDDFHQLRVR